MLGQTGVELVQEGEGYQKMVVMVTRRLPKIKNPET